DQGAGVKKLIPGFRNVGYKRDGDEKDDTWNNPDDAGNEQRQSAMYLAVLPDQAGLDRIDLEDNAPAIPRYPAPERQGKVNGQNIVEFKVLGKGVNEVVRLRRDGKQKQAQQQDGDEITDVNN